MSSRGVAELPSPLTTPGEGNTTASTERQSRTDPSKCLMGFLLVDDGFRCLLRPTTTSLVMKHFDCGDLLQQDEEGDFLFLCVFGDKWKWVSMAKAGLTEGARWGWKLVLVKLIKILLVLNLLLLFIFSESYIFMI